jgi:hypothetical protein
MVGLMTLRQAGARIELQRADWPKLAESDVETYEPDEIKAFFKASIQPSGSYLRFICARDFAIARWRRCAAATWM